MRSRTQRNAIMDPQTITRTFPLDYHEQSSNQNSRSKFSSSVPSHAVKDILLCLSFETICIHSSKGVAPLDTFRTVISCHKTWECLLVSIPCSALMLHYAPPKSSLQSAMLYWFPKDTFIVGFSTWYHSPASSLTKAALRRYSQTSVELLWGAFEIAYTLIYAARYVILIGMTLIGLHMIISSYMEQKRILAENLEIAIHSHADAIKSQSRTIEAASINICTSINQHGATIEMASAKMTREITSAANGICRGIEHHGDRIASAANLMSRSNAEYDRNSQKLLVHTEEQKLLPPLPENTLERYQIREAKMGLSNSRVGVATAILGGVGTIATLAGCSVM